MALDYLVAPFVILLFLFDPNFLHGPINFFEAGYYLGAVQCLFDGKIPYKDFYVNFGPFQIYMVKSAMLLFGRSLATLRGFFYFNYILSFLAIYLLSRQVCKRRFFAYVVSFACLVDVTNAYWAPRWDYGRMGLGIFVLFLLVAYLKRENIRALFGAGIVSAVALFYSFEIGFLAVSSSLIFLLVVSWVRPEMSGRGRARHALKNILWYGAGILCIVVPFFLYLSSKGALGACLNNGYSLLEYYKTGYGQKVELSTLMESDIPLSLMVINFFKVCVPLALYMLLHGYLLVSFFKKKWNKEKLVLFLLSMYGLLVYWAALRGAFQSPQFQGALPPLIILVVFCMEKGFDFIVELRKREKCKGEVGAYGRVKVGCIALFYVASCSYFVLSPKPRMFTVSFADWAIYQEIKEGLVAHYIHPVPIGMMDLVRSRSARVGKSMIPRVQEQRIEGVVATIEGKTQEGEDLLCFPDLGLYNFFADRPAFSRFHLAVFAYVSPAWRQELLNGLIEKKPRIIVRGLSLSSMAVLVGRSEELLPEVIQYIDNNYHIVARFDDTVVYALNV